MVAEGSSVSFCQLMSRREESLLVINNKDATNLKKESGDKL